MTTPTPESAHGSADAHGVPDPASPWTLGVRVSCACGFRLQGAQLRVRATGGQVAFPMPAVVPVALRRTGGRWPRMPRWRRARPEGTFRGDDALAWNCASPGRRWMRRWRVLLAAGGGDSSSRPAPTVFWGGYSGYFARSRRSSLGTMRATRHFPLAADGRLMLPGS